MKFSQNIVKSVLNGKTIKVPYSSIKVSNIKNGYINLKKCGKIEGINNIILCNNDHNGIFYNISSRCPSLLDLFPELKTIMDRFHILDCGFMTRDYNYLVPKGYNTFMLPCTKIFPINNYSQIINNINHVLDFGDSVYYKRS